MIKNRAQTILAIILVIEIITAFVAGPYSCDGGLTAYIATGFGALISAFFAVLWSDGLSRQQKSKHLLIGILLVIAIWLAGFFLGDFKILCKLF